MLFFDLDKESTKRVRPHSSFFCRNLPTFSVSIKGGEGKGTFPALSQFFNGFSVPGGTPFGVAPSFPQRSNLGFYRPFSGSWWWLWFFIGLPPTVSLCESPRLQHIRAEEGNR